MEQCLGVQCQQVVEKDQAANSQSLMENGNVDCVRVEHENAGCDYEIHHQIQQKENGDDEDVDCVREDYVNEENDCDRSVDCVGGVGADCDCVENGYEEYYLPIQKVVVSASVPILVMYLTQQSKSR